MKVSEITQDVILSHLREYADNLEYYDTVLLETIKKAAIEYCKSQTGLVEIEIDKHEDITVAVLTLISDMWDNRSMTVQKNSVNIVVDTILGMHRTNLLPTPDAGVV
ncbi:phage gp6-like head-tail connector protein [Blautia producta]|nr:phage gp6-like head-tail connector protein [Blautia producta]NSG17420.1 phage gp6-like head-tail connector protein [Blautia producta]NSJ77596.1 phage gp6-like head-tail connector protein [Blautia producta]